MATVGPATISGTISTIVDPRIYSGQKTSLDLTDGKAKGVPRGAILLSDLKRGSHRHIRNNFGFKLTPISRTGAAKSYAEEKKPQSSAFIQKSLATPLSIAAQVEKPVPADAPAPKSSAPSAQLVGGKMYSQKDLEAAAEALVAERVKRKSAREEKLEKDLAAAQAAAASAGEAAKKAADAKVAELQARIDAMEKVHSEAKNAHERAHRSIKERAVTEQNSRKQAHAQLVAAQAQQAALAAQLAALQTASASQEVKKVASAAPVPAAAAPSEKKQPEQKNTAPSVDVVVPAKPMAGAPFVKPAAVAGAPATSGISLSAIIPGTTQTGQVGIRV